MEDYSNHRVTAMKLRQWIELIANWFESPDIRAIKNRPTLPDADFHQEYYANTKVTCDTCAVVRRVLREQLGLSNTRPSDNIATLFPDLDIGEVCFEIGDVLRISFLDSAIDKLDGSVDSLIRATHDLRTLRQTSHGLAGD